MKPRERIHPLDLIKVSIKQGIGWYSFDAEGGKDVWLSFIRWLMKFAPDAYDKFIEPLLLVKQKTIGKSCGGEPRLARNDGLKEKTEKERRETICHE